MRHPDAPRGDRLPGQGGRPLRARRRQTTVRRAAHLCRAAYSFVRCLRRAAPIVGPRRSRPSGIRPAGAAPPASAGDTPRRAHRGAAPPASAGDTPRRGRAARVSRGYAPPGPRRPRPSGIRSAGAALPASAGAGPCARQAALIFVHASENTVTKSPRSWNTVQRSSTSCGGLNVSSALNSSSSSSSAALLGEQ